MRKVEHPIPTMEVEDEEFEKFKKKIEQFRKYQIPCNVLIKREYAQKTGLEIGKMYVATDIQILKDNETIDSYFKIYKKEKMIPCKYFTIIEYVFPN